MSIGTRGKSERGKSIGVLKSVTRLWSPVAQEVRLSPEVGVSPEAQETIVSPEAQESRQRFNRQEYHNRQECTQESVSARPTAAAPGR